MVEGMKSEKVMVTRGKGDPFVAYTRAMVFQDIAGTDGKTVMKGPLIGIEVEDERNFRLYAQPDQLEPIKGDK